MPHALLGACEAVAIIEKSTIFLYQLMGLGEGVKGHLE